MNILKYFFVFFVFCFLSCATQNQDLKDEDSSSIKSTLCKSNNNSYYSRPEKWLSYEKRNKLKSCARLLGSEFNINDYRINGEEISCTENPYNYYNEADFWLKWEDNNYKISCSRYNPQYNSLIRIQGFKKIR